MWYQFDRASIKQEGIKIISYHSKGVTDNRNYVMLIFKDISSNNWRGSYWKPFKSTKYFNFQKNVIKGT